MPESTDSVFHYTDANGLVGIFESGALWANHVKFMNDAAETKTAIERVSNIADRYSLSQDVDLGPQLRKNVERDDLFVTSFTTLRDDLGMWRGYGPDHGFAIEFDKSTLEEVAAAAVRPLQINLAQVFYSQIDFDRFVEDLCSRVSEPTSDVDLRDIVHAVTLLKEDSWASEQEYRLSLMLHVHEGGADAAAVSFRPGRFGATPYVRVPLLLPKSGPHRHQGPHTLPDEAIRTWPTGLVRSVTVGPGFHQETRRVGIATLARKLDLEFKIYCSEIAYR